MRVPDEIRRCVAFVGYERADGEYQYKGTAFFIGRPMRNVVDNSFVYLVTCKHVIGGIKGKSNFVSLRLNYKDGMARWVDTDIKKWHYHPIDQAVDVAVMLVETTALAGDSIFPMQDRPIDDHLLFPVNSFITDEHLDVERYSKGFQPIALGDEVFFTGLFHVHSGQRRNIPIIRVGNIAALPEEKVTVRSIDEPDNPYLSMDIDAYLVEARSLGGLSGSPVFTRPYDRYFLLGMLRGHWDTPHPDTYMGGDEAEIESGDILGEMKVNMGITTVVPASKIVEVLDHPLIRKAEDQVERAMIARNRPTDDSADSLGEGMTRHDQA